MNPYELFLNLIESVCFAVVTADYIKPERNKLPAYFFLFIAGQTAIITITNLFLFYEGFFSVIYNGFFFLMMYFFRKKDAGPSAGRILIYIILLNIIVSVCTEIALPAGMRLSGFDSLSSFTASSQYLSAVFFLSRPLVAVLLGILNTVSMKYRSMEPKYMSYYLCLFLGIYVLMTYLEGFIFGMDEKWQIYILINIVLSVIGFFSYHLLNLAAYDHFRYEEQMVIQDEMRLIHENMRMYEEEEKKLLEMRHNMKNELTIINGYLQSGQYEKSQKYIQDSIMGLNQLPVLISSNHPAVDMILSSKLSRARSLGIETQAVIQMENIKNEAEFDLALILGHLLDNAIENISSENKYISVRVEQEEEIVLSVQNSTDSNDNAFLSTKPDQKAHGFGLKQIKALAEAHDGGFTIQIADYMCTAIVILSDIS
ncbi:MAG: GHKL domain-containing protein [Solobacterium sp.]|nr:GHKL domain-containing protein [Solobacterium sp.]